MNECRIHEIGGAGIEPWLDQLGKLRIEVFRGFPYLYDGDEDYERNYLRRYLEAKDALVVLVTDDQEQVVGATTCLPMTEEEIEFRGPVEVAGLDGADVFYFGESVLLPEWRGRGIGHEFFDRREAYARKLGYRVTTFCAVDREEDHPHRPSDYRPLDGFWRKRGYEKQDHIKARFPWKQVGADEETEQTLTFWLKRWD